MNSGNDEHVVNRIAPVTQGQPRENHFGKLGPKVLAVYFSDFPLLDGIRTTDGGMDPFEVLTTERDFSLVKTRAFRGGGF